MGDYKYSVLLKYLNKLDKETMNYKEAGGYFMEYIAKELLEIVPILGKVCQTVAVLGIDSKGVRELLQQYGVRGVDRIVPVGKTMELSFRWDGYDMIEII